MSKGSNNNKCGIYAIVNTQTGERYVGQAVNIPRRWSDHRKALQSGQASPALQKAWNLYGEDAFTFIVLRICKEKHLDVLEEAYMAEGCEYNQAKNMIFSLGVNLNEGLVKAGPGPFAAKNADDLTDEDLEDMTEALEEDDEPPAEDAEEWEKIEWTYYKQFDKYWDLYNEALVKKGTAKQKQVLLDLLDYQENAGLVLLRKLRELGTNPLMPGFIYERLAILYRKEKNYQNEVEILQRYFALSVIDRDDRLADRLATRLSKAKLLLQKQLNKI